MPTRSRDWNETLSKELKDLEVARDFLLGLIDEGDNLQEALGRLIRSYGVKEYSALVGMPEPNIQRAISPEHNPTQKTLEALLQPLGLKLGVQKIDDAA